MTSTKGSFGSWLMQQGMDLKDPKLIALARQEVDKLLEQPGNVEPVRNFLDESGTEWRHGQPNYDLANLAFLKGKSMKHEKGSLEMVVENAVKSWEMETSHKVNVRQWKTVVHDKYSVSTCGGRLFKLDEASKRGNPNVLMEHVDKKLYDASAEDFDSSHKLFQSSFQGGFPWEVLKVFAGPPNIVFSWRHWGDFTGEYKGNKGDGQVVEVNGFAVVSVTDDLKITGIRVFYNPENFLRVLQGQEKVREDPTPQDYEGLLKIFIEKCDANTSKKITSSDCKFELNGVEVSLSPGDDRIDGEPSKTRFSWEIDEIFCKTPVYSFTWRHWIEKYDEKPPIELKGFAIVQMNEKAEIDHFQIFYKPEEVPNDAVKGLQKCPFANLKK